MAKGLDVIRGAMVIRSASPTVESAVRERTVAGFTCSRCRGTAATDSCSYFQQRIFPRRERVVLIADQNSFALMTQKILHRGHRPCPRINRAVSLVAQQHSYKTLYNGALNEIASFAVTSMLEGGRKKLGASFNDRSRSLNNIRTLQLIDR